MQAETDGSIIGNLQRRASPRAYRMPSRSVRIGSCASACGNARQPCAWAQKGTARPEALLGHVVAQFVE